MPNPIYMNSFPESVVSDCKCIKINHKLVALPSFQLFVRFCFSFFLFEADSGDMVAFSEHS